ncbi:MAG: alpha-glucosidase C-terminal domain-containing protein [Ignavibacteriales bacterium]|nr:alpha-glucosidase C-terminal domain-containing protein [Ignavibacteriales bacterium]
MTVLEGEWLFKVDSLDQGIAERWFSPDHQKSDWQLVELPSYWDRYGLEGYDGVGWYAKSVELGDSTGPLAVFFEGVDDDADVWVNGKTVGSHTGYSDAFYLDVTDAVKPGINEIVVRVNDHSGPGGIYRPVLITPLRRVEELLRTEYAETNARESADWVRDAVIYEVYLRSFSREGNLKGLEKRVHELKDLGVTVLWLMPVHPIGDLNRKGSLGSPYAVADYYAVNPEFGTMEDFKSLVKTVHDREMKIIIDLVANHTAWDSKLMFESPEWFVKDKSGAIVSPNSDWTDVADLNFSHHELRKYMINMMKYWVDEVGIDGFRCDVAELVPTDFWYFSRGELDKIKPILMLSEGTLPEHHVKAFDITYAWNTFDVLEKVIKGSTRAPIFLEILKNEGYRFPKGSLRMRFNANHDKNAWDSPAVLKFGREGAKATAVLMFTVPGIPLIYNGEEVGNEKRLSLFEKVDIDWRKGSDFRKLYGRLGSLRRNHPALRYGVLTELSNSDNDKILSFLRNYGADSVITVINFSNTQKTVTVEIGQAGAASGFADVFSRTRTKAVRGALQLTLPPLGFQILVPNMKGTQ